MGEKVSVRDLKPGRLYRYHGWNFFLFSDQFHSFQTLRHAPVNQGDALLVLGNVCESTVDDDVVSVLVLTPTSTGFMRRHTSYWNDKAFEILATP